MKTFTTEQIQSKFETLPKEIQAAITSSEVNAAVEEIAKKHNLQIDQMGELVDLVGLVMLGLKSSKDFVKEFSHEANINEDQAKVIADEINQEVFAKIRTSMREIEEKEEEAAQSKPAEQLSKPTHITDLEKAGGFTIENETCPMIKNDIPSRPIRFNNPGISTKKPINIPADEPVNTPIEMVQNEIPVPVKTPIQESVVTPIPEITSLPVPLNLTEQVNKSIPESLTTAVHESITEMLPESAIKPVAESITIPIKIVTNPIPTSMSEANKDSSPSEIAPVLKAEQKIEAVPEPVPEVHKEPLADQLLSALNKNPSKAPAPVNLPISGEEIATTSKDKPKSSDQYREPLG